MKEIGTGHVIDCADGILSYTIMIVSTNTTKTQFLVPIHLMVVEKLGIQGTIVSMDSENGDVNISSIPLKQKLPT